MSASRQLVVGDVIERLDDGRKFKITLLNWKGGVFSAASADGQWSGWGGLIAKLREGEVRLAGEPADV